LFFAVAAMISDTQVNINADEDLLADVDDESEKGRPKVTGSKKNKRKRISTYKGYGN